MLIPHHSQVERDHIDRCDLSSLLDIPRSLINWGLLIALAERWHSEHNTFHLPMGEMRVTPKDVYQIFCIPLMGELVYYDLSKQGGTNVLCLVFEDGEIGGYDIVWQEMLELGYATLHIVLARFIGGFLCLNHKSKGLSVGWDHLLEQMVTQGT